MNIKFINIDKDKAKQFLYATLDILRDHPDLKIGKANGLSTAWPSQTSPCTWHDKIFVYRTKNYVVCEYKG